MDNKNVLIEAIRCFGDEAHRPKYFSLYSDDVVLHGYEGVQPGIAAVKSFYEGFWRGFPDAAIDVYDLFEDEEKVFLRYNVTGTHRGLFLGIPSTDRRIDLPGMSVLKFFELQCVERWSVSDSLVLLRQLKTDL